MKSPHYWTSRYRTTAGQVLILFLLFAVVLLLFVGLGIDLGFAYITKARLSKALDAASLAAVANYSGTNGGDTYAATIAENTFWANYGSNGVTGLSGGVQVQPHGHFGTDANGNLTFTNSASATINTFFIGVLPQWKTLTVGDTAIATRAPVVMTLVIDRSGSMDPGCVPANCSGCSSGGTYLPGALNQFINIFDETLDQAALVSFATSSSNDVVMTGTGFKAAINGAITRINTRTRSGTLWAGHTCTMAGLTNALVIENNVNVTPNHVKVVVLFTDGLANTMTGLFTNTTPKGGVTLNFGGNDPIGVGCQGGNPGAIFFATNLQETATAQNNGTLGNTGCGNGTTFRVNGTNVNTDAGYTDSTGYHNYCAYSITEDATNRCVLLGNQMRATNIFVYAVGLAAPGQEAPPTIETLQQVANDPQSSTFDQTKPVGAAFLSDGQDLTEVFQQVAADIILRLVR